MAVFAARPSSSFGYWRGGFSDGPLAQNQGSRVYGQANSGAGIFPQGSGPVDSGGGWHPAGVYLLGFVAVEIGAFGLLGRGAGGGTGTRREGGAGAGGAGWGGRRSVPLPAVPPGEA